MHRRLNAGGFCHGLGEIQGLEGGFRPLPKRRFEAMRLLEQRRSQVCPAAGVRMSTLMIRLLALLVIAAVSPLAAADLPTGETPPGKVVLVPQPHHDDHSTDYGMAGLIARLIDEGFRAIYIRASNDEKDGRHGYPRNDMINERETKEAIAVLGMEKVNQPQLAQQLRVGVCAQRFARAVDLSDSQVQT